MWQKLRCFIKIHNYVYSSATVSVKEENWLMSTENKVCCLCGKQKRFSKIELFVPPLPPDDSLNKELLKK